MITWDALSVCGCVFQYRPCVLSSLGVVCLYVCVCVCNTVCLQQDSCEWSIHVVEFYVSWGVLDVPMMVRSTFACNEQVGSSLLSWLLSFLHS